MFSYPPSFLSFIVLAGAGIGLVAGLIALRLNFGSKPLALGFWGLLVDVVLGAAGFSGGVIATMLLPVPPHTTIRHVGGTVIRETTRRFQHPYLVGAAVAILFTFLFEFVRARRAKVVGPLSACVIACNIAFLPLPTPARAAENWVRLATTHFELYTTAGEKRGREAVLYFEQARSFFRDASSSGKAPDSPVRIVTFPSARQYQRYAVNAFAPAFYTHDADRDYIVMQELSPAYYPVAIHEYTHLIIEHSGLHLPAWMNEGWADLYSTMRPKGGKVAMGDLIPGRAQILWHATWIPLEELAKVDYQSPLYSDRDRVGMFYAESWALVHMLYLAPGYSKSFNAFVQFVSSGKTLGEACQQIFGKTVSDVEHDLLQYLAHSQLSAALLDTSLTKSEEEPDVSEPTFAELNAALADVLTLTNKTSEARAIYQSLLQQYPHNAFVEESLGYLAWHDGDREAARAHFLSALDDGTRSPAMCFRLGTMSRGTEVERADSIRAFRRALALKPAYTDARLHLGLALFASRSYAESLQELSAIHAVSDGDAHLYYSAKAFNYSCLGRYEEARQNAEGAKKWAKTPEEIEQIERLFRYIDEQTSAPR